MPVGISGLSSGIDSEDLIKKLVEVEKQPLQRMQQEKEILNLKIEVLNQLNRNLSELKDSAYKLYGLDSVFKLKKAFGCDENYFTAIPNINALPGNMKMEINQLAQAHSVASDPFDSNTKFKSGSFIVRVGTNERTVVFDGGTADQLALAVSKQSGDIMDAGAVQNTADTMVLSFTAKNPGKNNIIDIKDKDGVMSGITLLKKRQDSTLSLSFNSFDTKQLTPYNGYRNSLKKLSGDVETDNGTLILDNTAKEMNIQKSKISSDTTMQVTWTYRAKSATLPEPNSQAEGVDGNSFFARIFSVKVRELEIKGAPFKINEPETEDIPKTGTTNIISERESGIGIAFINGSKRTEKLFPLEMTTNEKTIDIPLDKGFDSINKLIYYSEDETSNLVLKNIKIYDKSKGGFDFAQTLQKPLNSLFKINDVEVERTKNNNIDDVIKNVSINLKQPTEKALRFNIDFDKEKISDNVISFISNYNRSVQLMAEVQKTAKTTEPGKYKAEDKGILSGDISVMNIRSKMRALMIAPYPTSISNRLALAMQAGISTGKFNTAMDDIRMGLLKFDREMFMKMFEQYPQATAELFGSDTDANKIIDNGLGYKMHDFLFNVTRVKSGIVIIMVDKTKNDVTLKEKEIAQKEKTVSAYEDRLKQQFLNMDKNMSGLKQQQKWLEQQDNANKNNK